VTNYCREPDPIFLEQERRRNLEKYNTEYASLLGFLHSNISIRLRFTEFEKMLDFYKARLWELEQQIDNS
jgi:hypothetical protein